MNLTRQQKLELIRKHEPVMWLHEAEAFHPVHCKVAAQLSELYGKNGLVNPSPALGDLPGLNGDHYLKLRHMDMKSLAAGRSPSVTYGPAALEQYSRANYGRNLYTDGFSSSRPPCYFARIDEVTLRKPSPRSRSKYPKGHPVEGDYIAIEYHFYFVYNDFWNQHQGDWDATTVVLVRVDEGEITSDGYLVTFAHGFSWVTRFRETNHPLNQWIGTWQSVRTRQIKDAYVLDGHPFIFVTQGGHGAYPTPGTICLGINEKILWLKRKQVIVTTDVRQIGKLAICPQRYRPRLIDALEDAGLPTVGLQSAPWREPELLTEADQPWLTYEGRWGQPSPFAGWAGPASDKVEKGTRPRDTVLKGMKAGYKAGDPIKVLKQWHRL